MRNIIVHDYFMLDKETLWDTVTYDLPSLDKIISQIIEKNVKYYSDMEENEDNDDFPVIQHVNKVTGSAS